MIIVVSSIKLITVATLSASPELWYLSNIIRDVKNKNIKIKKIIKERRGGEEERRRGGEEERRRGGEEERRRGGEEERRRGGEEERRRGGGDEDTLLSSESQLEGSWDQRGPPTRP